MLLPTDLTPQTLEAFVSRLTYTDAGEDRSQHWIPPSGEMYVPAKGNVDPKEVAYVASTRAIVPVDRTLRSTCGVPSCVNPAHLMLIDPRREQVLRYRRDGHSLRWIARETGVAINTVRSWTSDDARRAIAAQQREQRRRRRDREREDAQARAEVGS